MISLASVYADNATSSESIVLLGASLFRSKDISFDGQISCSSCHRPDNYYTDGYELALARDIRLTRNTPSLLTVTVYDRFFWDGTVSSIQEAIKLPLIDGAELRSSEEILKKKLSDNQVALQLKAKHGYDSFAELSVEAIKAYIENLQTVSVKYWDRPEDLSQSQRRGLSLFTGRARCVECHSGKHFTDGRLRHSSIFKRKIILAFDGSTYSLTTDYGHGRVNSGKKNVYKFRTPSLINVALTPPYMHDGSFTTLEQVIDYYNRGGDDSRFPLPRIDLSRQDKSDLIEFLKTLSDERYVKNEH